MLPSTGPPVLKTPRHPPVLLQMCRETVSRALFPLIMINPVVMSAVVLAMATRLLISLMLVTPFIVSRTPLPLLRDVILLAMAIPLLLMAVRIPGPFRLIPSTRLPNRLSVPVPLGASRLSSPLFVLPIKSKRSTAPLLRDKGLDVKDQINLVMCGLNLINDAGLL